MNILRCLTSLVWLSFLVVLFAACPELDGFDAHLAEAIELNTTRKSLYSQDSGGESDLLFNKLIQNEILLRPVAKAIDVQARPFVEDGIYIVVNDFVPMDAKPYGTPIKDVRTMASQDRQDVRQILAALRGECLFGLERIAAAASQAIVEIEALEEERNLYFAMTKHVIESLGFAALHGIQYNCQSGGLTSNLVNQLVGVQVMGIALTDISEYDELANRLQVQGLGALVNELPLIPFQAEYHLFVENAFVDCH